MRRPVRGALVVAMVAGTVLAGTPVAGAVTAEQVAPRAAQVGATAPVHWGPCTEDALRDVPEQEVAQFSCATYPVPVDHDRAAEGTIDLALMRRAAAKPQARIGSLFLNPGGPGGSGLRMPVAAPRIFEAEVLDRFDTIGFDPRGVGASGPVRCFTTAEDSEKVFGAQRSVPLTGAEISGSLAAYRDYGRFCHKNAGALLAHMSTKDVVRDLDMLRAAVGDRKLNYVGFSYGTLIGATYANMFPANSRALVIDGNVDPALRTKDGLEYDRERAKGFEISLDAFLTECERVREQCAFGSGRPREKFDELRTHLRHAPMALPTGRQIDISTFTDGVSGALYSPQAFRGLAEDLQALYDVIHPPTTQVTRVSELSTLLRPPQNGRFDVRPDSPYTGDDSYFGVNCSDKPFRHDQAALPGIAADWERESPTFGRTQAFSDPAACPVWPVRKPDAYRGPWNRATENPVLVIGNHYDPATQYLFAKRMADELGSSRLLSVDAFGHCILGDSAGVDKATADYLVDLKVPAPGQVFVPDTRPFDPPPAS
jgi:pimeloyl-ACP methyl ester carboxylesterase